MRRVRLHIFLISAIVWFAFSCDTGSNIEPPDESYFMKLYGMDGDQEGVDLTALNDGTFLLLGNTVLENLKQMYLVNVDSEGDIIWERNIGGTTDVAIDIEPTPDGNFVILSTVETGPANIDIKLIRIQPDGTKIDSVIYGSPENDNAQSVTPLTDGGFIVAGGTLHDEAPYNPQDPDAFSNAFHFRCDATLVFDPNWDEFSGNTGRYDAATKVFEVGGLFYVFGYSDVEHNALPPGKINLQYYALGSLAGASAGPNYLGDFNDNTTLEFVTAVPQEMGGGYAIIGTRASGAGAVTIHATKLRSDLQFDPLDEQFDTSVPIDGKTLEAVAIAPVKISSRGYLLLANETSAIGTTNIFIVKIDQSANPQWSVSLGSDPENDRCAAALELADGRIFVLGTIELGNNQSKMALYKLNSSGRLQE